jgi:hypothetical protein
MVEIMQNIVDVLSAIILGIEKDEQDKVIQNEKVTYTLTSVFPSQEIMKEAIKYL